MPVHQTVPRVRTMDADAEKANNPERLPKNTQPTKTKPIGTKAATATTPSRASQEDRHCENARQARSGRPRWAVDDKRPAEISAIAPPIPASPRPSEIGTRPR